MKYNPIPETAIVHRWQFTPDDWDRLHIPFESGDMAMVDFEIRNIVMENIGRRYSPVRIRAVLAGNK